MITSFCLVLNVYSYNYVLKVATCILTAKHIDALIVAHRIASEAALQTWPHETGA